MGSFQPTAAALDVGEAWNSATIAAMTVSIRAFSHRLVTLVVGSYRPPPHRPRRPL